MAINLLALKQETTFFMEYRTNKQTYSKMVNVYRFLWRLEAPQVRCRPSGDGRSWDMNLWYLHSLGEILPKRCFTSVF